MKTRSNRVRILFLFLCLPLVVAAQPQVQTGAYLLNLYDLNMDEHSFYADIYIWFKWKGLDFDPTAIELVNAVEKWGLTQSTFNEEAIDTLEDGTNYKMVRVEGRFFHSYKLANFPLDEHELEIHIESPEFHHDQLVYVPDTGNAAVIRPTLHIDGWRLHSPVLKSSVHDYASNFGNPMGESSEYSKITFSFKLERPLSYFLLKMMLPLFVVILVSIGALLLHPQYIDTRAQLPIGGLLTAVFLQQSYSTALPDTGYMVLMDKIYLLAYGIISGVLLLVILAGNALVQPEEAVVRRIDWREAWQSTVLFILFVAGVLFLCWGGLRL